MENIEKPIIRVRVSAKHEAGQKGMVPDVTVEITTPDPLWKMDDLAPNLGTLAFNVYTEVSDKVIEYLNEQGLSPKADAK